MAASLSEKPQDKLHRLKENGMFWGHTVTLHRVGFVAKVFHGCLCALLRVCSIVLHCLAVLALSLLSWILAGFFRGIALTQTTGFFRGLAWTNVGTHESRGQVTSLGLDMTSSC